MRLFRADPAARHHTGIPSALRSLVDEVYAALSQLFAYVAALALLGGLSVYLWQRLPDATAMEPAAAGWGLADHSAPAFAMSRLDPRDKTEAYEIFRHPQGGRKDVFRWNDAALKPIAELFAHAELRRTTDRVTSGPPALSPDWVMGSENPRLRGAL